MFGKRKQKQIESEGKEQPVKTEEPNLTLESTQMWSPVYDIKDGVIITKNEEYVQVLEFAPVNFELFPDKEKEDIADMFGASLSVFPRQFQIKILSRKANVDAHVNDYLYAKQHESNEQCRKMQDQSIKKIQDTALNSISRRFFIAHKFENDGGLRRPSWNKIRSDLTQTSYQIARCLGSKPCNNMLLSGIGDTDAQLDILYQCMNRSEAEAVSLQNKVSEVVKRYAAAGKLDGDNLTIPVNEFIAPPSVDPYNYDQLIVGDKHYAFAYIDGNSYPTQCPPGWVQRLVDLGEGIDIDIFVEKKNSEEVSRNLIYTMQKDGSDLRHKSEASADVDHLESKLISSKYIRNGLSHQFTLCDFYIMLTIVEDSAEALKWKLRDVRKIMATNGLKFCPLNFRHQEAFRTSLPLCSWDKKNLLAKAKRNILNCDFGAFYPFVSFEIDNKGGFMLGINKVNLSPIYLNLFDRNIYSDGNVILLGPPGTGKTYCVQTMALALRQLGVQVIIIVPYKGYEYRAACEAVGGEFISLAPGSKNNINIMEIRRYDTTVKEALEGGKEAKGSILAAKIQQIHAFVSLLKPDMDYLEKQALDDAVRLTYKEYGITLGNKSLIDPQNPSRYKRMPTLGDLYAKLKTINHSEGLQAVLSRFVTGSAQSFNGQTNVNLDNQYIVIDISDMPKELVPMGTFVANDYAIDCIRADNTKRKAIFNDEISRMIGIAGSAPAAEFILQNCKLVRGYNAIVVNATQDTNDFFALNNGVYGKGIIANSKIKIVLRQEPQEARTIAELLNLSEEEETHIQYYEPGEGLLVANRSHSEIKVLASTLEDELINSDPEHIKQRLQKQGIIGK